MDSENLTIPNSIKLCEYFNEIGLINPENINTFLNIYTDVIKTSEKKEETEFLKIALFSYMKLILEDDKTLFDYIERTISSFNNHQLISKYKALKDLKSYINFKLRNLFNFFFFKLILKINKEKFQNQKSKLNSNQNNKKERKYNSIYKKQLFNNLDLDNSQNLNNEKKELKKKNISSGNLNLTERNIFNNNFINSNSINNNFHTTKASSERVLSLIKKENFENNINNENSIKKKYNNKNIKNKDENFDIENIQSYTIYTPALQIQSKIPFKNIIQNDYKSRPVSESNIVSLIDLNNDIHFNLSNGKKISSSYLTNKTFNSINNNSYDFYNSQSNHLEKINEKILNMKIEQINEIEQNCTFRPKINKYKSKKVNFNNNNNSNNEPRYIQLNKDAKIRKENLDNLKLQLLNIELEKDYLSNPQNSRSKSINNDPLYYEKLYNDAKILKQKNLDNLKKANEEFTFTPEINENKDYIVTMSFNQRINKSIENKKKFMKIKEEKDNEFINKINQNLKNVNSNELINRLYNKEIDKIKMKQIKKMEEEEKKNKKPCIINWEKVFKENNGKYSDNIYYKRKKFNMGKEEEKDKDYNQNNSNNLDSNDENLEDKNQNTNSKGIKILLKNENNENTIENNIENNIKNKIENNKNNQKENNKNNNNNTIQNNKNDKDNNNINENKKKYDLHYNLLNKIKNEPTINFKNPNQKIENNNLSSPGKENKKTIEFQSISDYSQNINDKNNSSELLYTTPYANITNLTPITDNDNKKFMENNILDSIKSNSLREFLIENDKK